MPPSTTGSRESPALAGQCKPVTGREIRGPCEPKVPARCAAEQLLQKSVEQPFPIKPAKTALTLSPGLRK